VALDRLIALHERQRLPINVAMFRQVRDDIRETIERRGYNEAVGSYTRLLDGDDLDASLLTLPLYATPRRPIREWRRLALGLSSS
jgi:GH15 family glucan-1,4-alpha-glucosidase